MTEALCWRHVSAGLHTGNVLAKARALMERGHRHVTVLCRCVVSVAVVVFFGGGEGVFHRGELGAGSRCGYGTVRA